MSLRVGFVGLGTMGVPMARNLAQRGFQVLLTSRSREKAQGVADTIGARVHDTVAELAAEADVIVSCVPDGPEVEGVHRGTLEGVRDRPRAERPAVIDCSTIAAEVWRRIHASLEAEGVAAIDAPMSGGQKGAVEGTLSFFVGGDAAAVERCRPVLEAMGTRITHLGPAGAGQLGKATNQILVAINLLAVSESLAFAARAGLPLEALHQALLGGAARSWALEVLGKKILEEDWKPAFAIRHQQKDLAIVLQTARERGVPLPGAALVHQLLGALEAQGHADDGTQALARLYQQLSGRPA